MALLSKRRRKNRCLLCDEVRRRVREEIEFATDERFWRELEERRRNPQLVPFERQSLPKNGMRPIHAGEIILEEFLKPLGMSAGTLADAMGVPHDLVSAIVAEERGIGETQRRKCSSCSNFVRPTLVDAVVMAMASDWA